jgi:hypothetical protein
MDFDRMSVAPPKQWYVLDVNPQPWAVGPLSVARGGKGYYPKMGQNQQLATYQDAVRAALTGRYPNLVEFETSAGGASLFGNREVELCFYFFQKQEQAEKYDARTKTGTRTVTSSLADLTNMVKAAEDAVAGILFDNDIQVRAQRNVTVEHGLTVPEGVVIISIEMWHGMNPSELPDFVWREVEIIGAGPDGNPDQLDLFSS